jgi:glycosyltransferase involved in cell wall biosynthesis
MNNPRLAVVVHGRFYAFDLVRELLRLNVDVTLFTNYPRNIVERFGVPRGSVVNCVAHGAASRMLARLPGARSKRLTEPFLHRWFSKWASRAVAADYDSVFAFSGIAEELFTSMTGRKTLRTLVRASSHIATQSRLLEEEEQRVGRPIDKPSRWMIAREQREYAVADAVVVLSTFALNSFREHGFPPEKLHLNLLGGDVRHFRPAADVVAQRSQRITSGQPLRVLTVGTFSARKGALDLAEMARRLDKNFQFRFVGSVTPEVREAATLPIEFMGMQPQRDLPAFYNWADLFVFPTIEDGFPVVLAQAQAAGLPIVATANCSAADIVTPGKTGWILPIRSPDAFVERLTWLAHHRTELADVAAAVYHSFRPRDWSAVAAEFLAIQRRLLAESSRHRSAVDSPHHRSTACLGHQP